MVVSSLTRCFTADVLYPSGTCTGAANCRRGAQLQPVRLDVDWRRGGSQHIPVHSGAPSYQSPTRSEWSSRWSEWIVCSPAVRRCYLCREPCARSPLCPVSNSVLQYRTGEARVRCFKPSPLKSIEVSSRNKLTAGVVCSMVPLGEVGVLVQMVILPGCKY